jgi:hypothetical protein
VPDNDVQILTRAQARSRAGLLAELQQAFAVAGVRSVLAGRRRIVLRGPGHQPWASSGQTDPQLFVFLAAGTCVATTDGSVYRFTSGQVCGAGDPASAAVLASTGGASTGVPAPEVRWADKVRRPPH